MDPITFVLIDESVLTNGMRVLVDGISTEQFAKNPVMFYLHNDWSLPIGKWTNVRKESGQILADADFDEDDDDKEVQRIIKKVKKGYIKMASAGLVDLELSDDAAYRIDRQTGYTVLRSRLREASIVPIGRNHNSMAFFRLYDADGNELNPAKKEDELKLSDFIVKPKIESKMTKKYLQILNLADGATDEMIEAAIDKLLGDKKAATARADKAESDLKELRLADARAKRTAFEAELDAAFKDGRLSEKPDGVKLTPVKDGMLNLFDKDPEGTRVMLASIAKPQKLQNMELGYKDSKEFKELEAMDYGQMDKAGKALLCRDKYPDMYKEKYKAKFGKEPKMS